MTHSQWVVCVLCVAMKPQIEPLFLWCVVCGVWYVAVAVVDGGDGGDGGDGSVVNDVL